jgi:GNAT superfamily N-acetyltransferase
LISIVRTTSDHEHFSRLVRLLDHDLNTRYGTVQAIYDQYNIVELIEAVVLAYVGPDPIACGGYKKYDNDSVEIKRMYVKPEYRGRGIASKVLLELENWANEIGYSVAILETGSKQQEAISLYRKEGYEQIENYGQYEELPYSVCFKMNLDKGGS